MTLVKKCNHAIRECGPKSGCHNCMRSSEGSPCGLWLSCDCSALCCGWWQDAGKEGGKGIIVFIRDEKRKYKSIGLVEQLLRD